MTIVAISEDAEEHLRELKKWWDENRSAAPRLVKEEFQRCVALLEGTPEIGVRFHRARVLGVRRLLMKKTKNFVYYLYDPENAVVYVMAVWARRSRAIPCSAIRAD